MPSISLPSASTLAIISAAATVIGGGISAYGAISSGQAAAGAASYQAEIQKNNATIADQNAARARAAGEAQVTAQRLKTAAAVGAIKNDEAASGLDVNSGSPLDVQSSAKELGELDAETTRNQAAVQAYGYQTAAAGNLASAQLDQSKAAADTTAGLFGATGSVIGGASSAANSYARYLTISGSGRDKLNSMY